jgi:hypothetical protein
MILHRRFDATGLYRGDGIILRHFLVLRILFIVAADTKRLVICQSLTVGVSKLQRRKNELRIKLPTTRLGESDVPPPVLSLDSTSSITVTTDNFDTTLPLAHSIGKCWSKRQDYCSVFESFNFALAVKYRA